MKKFSKRVSNVVNSLFPSARSWGLFQGMILFTIVIAGSPTSQLTNVLVSALGLIYCYNEWVKAVKWREPTEVKEE